MTWQNVRLAEIGSWFGGMTPSKSVARYWEDGSFPWLSPKDMGPESLAGTIDLVSRVAVAETSLRLVPAGSVAIVVRSGILERTIPVAQVPFETALNQDMKAIVPRPDVDGAWLAWGLRAFERQLLESTRKRGTTVASLEVSRLRDFSLPLPPFREQRRIVEILEDHLSRLGAASEGVARSLQRAERLLEAREVQAHAGVRARMVRLADVLQTPLANGKSVPTREGGFPVLRLTAIKDGRVDLREVKQGDWDADDASRFLVHAGDVMIVRGNGALRLVGRAALVEKVKEEAAYPDTLIRAVADRHQILPEYLTWVLNSRPVRSQVERKARTTAGIYKVNQKDLGRLVFALPQISDQESILEAIAVARETTTDLKATMSAVAQRSELLRQALLQAAFAGRLTGRDSDLERTEELVDA